MHERNWRNKQWITRQGKTRGGGPFSEASLQRLLTSVIYAGQVRYKQEVHAGLQEAIVPHELFKMVQGRLAAQPRAAKSKSGCSRALLKGLLQCRGCGRPMGHTFCSRGTRRYRYYVCAGARQRRGACRSLPAVPIEALVVRRFGSLADERTSADVKAPQEANELPTAADRFASAWEDLDPQQRTDLLQRMVARIGRWTSRPIVSADSDSSTAITPARWTACAHSGSPRTPFCPVAAPITSSNTSA